MKNFDFDVFIFLLVILLIIGGAGIGIIIHSIVQEIHPDDVYDYAFVMREDGEQKVEIASLEILRAVYKIKDDDGNIWVLPIESTILMWDA